MDLTPKSVLGGLLAVLMPTKVSQLQNDSGFQTSATINSTVVPRYAKNHMTDAAGNLSVTFPAGRFSAVPCMPDPTVVINDANFVYKAVVTAKSATGCTIKVTRQNVSVANLLGLTTLNLNVAITAPVSVDVFAIQQTD